MSMTADELLQGVKDTITFVDSPANLDDAAILRKIDDVIKTHIVPLVNSSNGEFFVTEYRTPVVAGQSEYDIPYRAIGRSIRDLLVQDSSGNRWSAPYIEPEDVHLYEGSALTWGHYFRGDVLVLVPEVEATYSSNEILVMPYKIRPSQLTLTGNAALVSSVSPPDVTVADVGSLVTGSVVDFIKGRSGHSLLSIDQTITNISGGVITFGSDVVPSRLSAGDYISLAGTSPVVNMIPDEFRPLIEKTAARLVLLGIDDEVGIRSLDKFIQDETKRLESLIEPRNPGEPKKIVNRSGLARGSKFARNRWYIRNV